MVVKVFGILDVKADAYLSPFFMPTIGMATRAFGDHANDPQSSISKHPEDYKLVQLAEFDDATGKFTSIEPVSFGFATEFKRAPQDAPLGS